LRETSNISEPNVMAAIRPTNATKVTTVAIITSARVKACRD